MKNIPIHAVQKVYDRLEILIQKCDNDDDDIYIEELKQLKSMLEELLAKPNEVTVLNRNKIISLMIKGMSILRLFLDIFDNSSNG
ncbi:hypothetical protein AB7102_06725 [Providencia manganoxydans]|uniref:hypothetical protein n=1 Tax=Morganellaceae TaxID=1903414 RepID=UPI0018C6F93C|nr:hypothetical protein [Proteus terrae]MBG3090650.1 hypothetical protein [Proteus terrae subsp. cibarius]